MRDTRGGIYRITSDGMIDDRMAVWIDNIFVSFESRVAF